MDNTLQKDRIYELIIGDYKNNKGLLINNLQVTFDISKSSNNKHRTNSAAIEIYNLSEESLKILDTDYAAASFSVGYRLLGMKRLFGDQITNVTTRKSGADRITQIQMGDKYTELNHKVLSSLVPSGKTVKDVLEDIRKAIPGVSRGFYNGTNLSNPIIYGYPLTGSPRDMLDELSSKYNIDWQIDGNVLYSHNSDRALNENFSQAYVISKYTGLIDNVYRVSGDSRRSKKDVVKKQGVQFKVLLNPDLMAGSIIKIEDTLINGWYKIDSLRHSGGWRDSSWYTEVQASAIEKVDKTNGP
jgi:hypothetical protein